MRWGFATRVEIECEEEADTQMINEYEEYDYERCNFRPSFSLVSILPPSPPVLQSGSYVTSFIYQTSSHERRESAARAEFGTRRRMS